MQRRIWGFMCIIYSLEIGCSPPAPTAKAARKDPLEKISVAGFQAGNPLASLDEHPWRRYKSIVMEYSSRYELDWLLVLSVIRQESDFRADALSRVGAYGLMQIMPKTQQRLTTTLGIDEARSPHNNIRAGIFHLKTLCMIFRDAANDDRVRLALAAYNAGLGRVLDARQLVAYFGKDPNSWPEVRDALPLLSRRYYTLHRNVWNTGKPTNGWFTDWRQTTDYVEKVMNHYDLYLTAGTTNIVEEDILFHLKASSVLLTHVENHVE